MFQPTSNITEQIADHLTWEIVTGRLPDRARIQELKLAKELDVSRGSVREALLLLQGRHLVEIVPRKGASVRPLDQHDIEPFGELFADLLARALRRVKLTPGERDLALLEPICMAAKQGETEALIRERQRVLRELAGRSNDRYLLSVLDPLFATAGRIAFVATRHSDFDPRDSYRCCNSLMQSLAARDHDQVVALLHAFIRRECCLASKRKR